MPDHRLDAALVCCVFQKDGRSEDSQQKAQNLRDSELEKRGETM